MDAGKVPVKLVKVTRVLGRTGMIMVPGYEVCTDARDIIYTVALLSLDEAYEWLVQVPEEVSPKSASSLWTIPHEASFVTSKAQVSNHPGTRNADLAILARSLQYATISS